MRTEAQKEFRREYYRLWRLAFPDKVKAIANRSAKKCYWLHRKAKTETQLEFQREYVRLCRLAFPEKYRARSKEYYHLNTELCNERSKEYRTRNRAYFARKNREYRIKDPARFRAQDNKRLEYKKAYMRKRRRENPSFHILEAYRRRIWEAVRGKRKFKRSKELLGCSIPDFKMYLESRFEVGMSWDNYGKGDDKWNIHHIMPCAIFDLTKPEHQQRCFHFSNMMPMWEPENLRINKYPTTNQFNLI